MSDVIYKTDTCPNCTVLEAQLAKNPIPGVRLFNIDRDPVGREYFERMSQITGIRAVPVAIIDGNAVVGTHQILGALRAKYARP